MQTAIVTRIVTATAMLASVAGCRRTPEMLPRLIRQGEPVGKEFWLAAPYLLVIKVTGSDLVGSLQPSFQGGPKILQLVKFSANVENAIKGNFHKGPITFFFFANIDQTPTYFLDRGKRYIVSLRSEGGILRSWADASQLKIEVHSGEHSQAGLPLDLGPEATIAYILLTPGTDCDLKTFANTLDWPRYGDPGYVNERLKQLERRSDRDLGDAACVVAASIFWHRPPCLRRCLQSSNPKTRESAARFLETDRVNLLGRLQDDPSSLFPKPWSDYVWQMLAIYTEDTRPEVRRAACRALQKISPQPGPERCK